MVWSGHKGLKAVLAALAMLAALALPRDAHAIDLADVANPAPQSDLSPYLAGLETEEREVQIERPDSHTSIRTVMTLKALGPGPSFRWVAVGFTNSAQEPRDVIISMPFQGFSGSKLLAPRLAGPRIYNVVGAGEIAIQSLAVPAENAFLFTLKPGETASIAFELTGGEVPGLTMWQREAYDARKDWLSFFRGALLGVAALLTLALFALYGFRSRSVFPIAGGFAAACFAFMTIETGHLLPLVAGIGSDALNPQTARAIVEGAMAAFLILLLAALCDLQRLSRLGGNLLFILGGLAFAVPIYGFAEPLVAVTIARIAFGITVIAGFLLIFLLWKKGEARGDTALLSWGAILLWSFLAAVAMISPDPGSALPLVLIAGLCAVLIVLAFTLAHHAFSHGYLSRHFFRESGRHALALAGARAYVWDWQPEEGELSISSEIERALSQPEGVIAEAGGEAFVELMHPSDRAAYLAAIADRGLDGRAPVEKEFRLRHGDGSWRWFQLRARAITGHGQRAVRCIGTLTDVTNAKLAEERLLRDAVYDTVTGLPNRALFVDRLERALKATHPGHAVIHVLLIDIDRFRILNEAMGHEAGDALLAIVGRRLKAEAGSDDSLARMPGDKFAILFAEIHGDRDLADFASGLVKAVARPITLDGQEYFLTASVGIATARGDGASAEQLLKNAAVALYEAKRQGAEHVELFDPRMEDDRAELVLLEAELRRAIERNEIEVHYQPIARLADMHLAGFEALVRWRHPTLGLLSPESFISLAEQTGMIRDIGRAVLNEAGRQLGIWQRAYRPAEPVFVAVNVSSAQLIEPDLLDDVKQIIAREGVIRGSFKLEVTESLVMQYPERAAQLLERFREQGVGLACDDFGTGYSSLSSLRKLPFDTLKVDRSFIAADAQDQRAIVILDSIIAMGHALGLTIVAEGVETQDQVDRLGSLDCDYGQGYFIGRPLTAKQVSESLAGMPYASSAGRTAITWLWERAQKDPPPAPRQRRVTAQEIEEERTAAARSRAPAPPPAAAKPRAFASAPAPAVLPAAAPADTAALRTVPERSLPGKTVPEVSVSEAHAPPEQARKLFDSLPDVPEDQTIEGERSPERSPDRSDVQDFDMLARAGEPPRPAPRRRKRPRRTPTLG
jgi:diguanylate cyclase (GGDEF)-like protein